METIQEMDMIISVILAVSSSLLLAVCWMLRRRARPPVATKRDESLARLEEVLRSAQLTNDGFFRSLELVQKNLESLLARAENAEQRMRNLMLQPGGEKREQYTAAAVLLGEGQEPRRVASMLNLPLPQVELVQELHRMASKEKKSMPSKRRSDESSRRDSQEPTKVAARREKSAQPILLTDILKRAANESNLREGQRVPFAGTTA
ncbi:MAG TPA: hypothetical protein VGA27_13175 [Candidatus Binatia bacterium]